MFGFHRFFSSKTRCCMFGQTPRTPLQKKCLALCSLSPVNQFWIFGSLWRTCIAEGCWTGTRIIWNLYEKMHIELTDLRLRFFSRHLLSTLFMEGVLPLFPGPRRELAMSSASIFGVKFAGMLLWKLGSYHGLKRQEWITISHWQQKTHWW